MKPAGEESSRPRGRARVKGSVWKVLRATRRRVSKKEAGENRVEGAEPHSGGPGRLRKVLGLF